MPLEIPTQPFNNRVQEALSNPERLAAINRAAVRFYNGRTAVMGSLPDAEATRDYARTVRAHTIANLDRYLEEFETNAKKAGSQVHWAVDAGEARQIVLDIAKKTSAGRIVKSKSMVTEEINLNHALEKAGLEVFESDLGEYIAQLGNDRPSHIIAPVLHLTRQEVGHIFAEKLGVPFTDDPLELNAIARSRLREVYLTADIGITGCNFAVAETGSVCLVTNEGNGRMVTTLPRVHIAIMGMERLVPTIEDLSVMLQLLARSATGQRLSTYTSLVTGTRRQGEPHGPEESHIIIVDNGRSEALAGDLAEILYCIRCGACLNVCPVYRAIGGHTYGSTYPGPIGSVVSPIYGGMAAFSDLPNASTLCGACEDICPVRIQLPTLLLRLRRNAAEAGFSAPWITMGIKSFGTVTRSPGRFSLALRLAGIVSRLTGGRWLQRLPGPLKAWTAARHFPPFAAKSFQQYLREHPHE